MTHQGQVIEEMKLLLERAAIRDAQMYRGYRRAAVLAVYLHEVASQTVNPDHKEWIDARINDLRAWLREDWEMMSGINRDDIWEDIARVLDPDRAEENRL